MSNPETESDVHSTASNDHLSVTVTKRPHCQIKFDIQVKPEAVEAAYHKALKNVNKEVSLPGFRKGKVPDKMILERYSSTVHKEFVELVLQTGFNEAIQLIHLHPLKDGQIKRPIVHECSREKGAHFTLEFEARPVIPSVKLEDLQIQRVVPSPITEQDRQNALHHLLLQFAKYDPVEDRPVQEDDFVNVSVIILEDPPREVIRNQRTQVNATGLPGWLRQKVIGLRAGESAEGMTEQDPHLIEPDSQFQSLPFRITVHAIWQGHLPAVDEELAKRVGLQTVDELDKKIDERLHQEAQEEAFKLEIQALEQLLVKKYPIDLPQSYIDANAEARLSDYLQQLERQQHSYSEEDYQRIQKSIEESAIFHLQLFFLLRKIASDYHITVDQQDVSQEASRQVALIPSGRSHVNFNDREKLHEQLYHLALDRKIKQFLIDHISFKD